MSFEETYKKQLLCTFTSLIQFLDRNNLKWFVAGGTLIAAVRHKGLIPWDDDIDIHMPREDFEKLLLLRSSLINSDYEIKYLDKNSEYYMPFAKFCYKHSTLWEFKERPCLFGVYVDILPLDYINGNVDSAISSIDYFREIFSLYARSTYHYSYNEIIYKLIRGQWRVALSNVITKLFYSSRLEKYRLNFRNLESKFIDSKGDFLVCHGGAYKYKEIYKAEWYETTIELPFEDFKVCAPKCYDAILTQLYGNYMTLPPQDKRIASHDDRYYVNLKEGLSIEEVKKRIQTGEFKVY